MTPGETFALIVLLFGVTGMFVHRTAAVLVAAWIIGQGWWHASGDSLPIGLYVVVDMMAATAIFTWATTKTDWAVLSIYPVMWVTYLLPISPYNQWWTLFGLAAAQFIIAGPWPAFHRNRTAEGRRVKTRLIGLARTKQ